MVDPLDIGQIPENRCFVPSRQDVCVCLCVCVCVCVVRSSIRATIRSTITRVHFTIPRFYSRIAVDISVRGGGRMFPSSRTSRIHDGRGTTYEGVLKRARTRLELAALRGWFSSSAGYRLPCTQCHIVGTRGADTTPASTETLHGVAKPACQRRTPLPGRMPSFDSIMVERYWHWPRNSIGICGGGDLTDLSNLCVRCIVLLGDRWSRMNRGDIIFVVDFG